MTKYYFDTSIWLDLFENRNKPRFPKGDLVNKLLKKVLKNKEIILFSNLIILEFISRGYSLFEVQRKFNSLDPIVEFVETTEKEERRANDISKRRKIPKGDVIHALLARKNNAILVTFDNHFKKLTDFAKIKTPIELIHD